MTILTILLAFMVVSAALCVMVRNLLKAAIALALTSAILTVVMFMLDAPLAAVFELSVCAGLVTVVFVSAISMTKPHSREEIAAKVKERLKRFIYLPFILLALLVVMLVVLWPCMDFSQVMKAGGAGAKVQEVLWNNRQTDILGQIVIILTGVFGIVVLFKERETK